MRFTVRNADRVELLPISINPLGFSADVLCPLSPFHGDQQLRKALVTQRYSE